MKYAVTILTVVLVIFFLPQLLGMVLGSALFFSILPTETKVLVGAVIILLICGFMARSDKQKQAKKIENSELSSVKLKD